MLRHDPDEFRLREAHHRIANDLTVLATMVRLQAGAVAQGRAPIDPAEAGGLLKDAASRVEAVARLHRALCSDLNGRTAADFLSGVCEDAGKLGGAGWTVRCKIDLKRHLPHEQLRALGLLIHEFVLNALKHAHPTGINGAIDVWVRDEDGALAVDVRDDGVGFPGGFDPRASEGFGFRMIRELARQLNCTLAYKSSPLGLTCRVRGKAKVMAMAE